MFIEPTNVAGWVAIVVFAALSLSLILAFARLVMGPSLADRIVALDLVAYLAVAFMIAYAIVTDEIYFLDPALVLALIAFLGTIAFSRFLEHRSQEIAESNDTHPALHD